MSAAEPGNDVTLVSSKHTNAVKLVPGPNDANIAKLVARILEKNHYLQQPFNNEVAGKFLDRYLDFLDNSHLYFTQSDLDEFDAYRTTLDERTMGQTLLTVPRAKAGRLDSLLRPAKEPMRLLSARAAPASAQFPIRLRKVAQAAGGTFQTIHLFIHLSVDELNLVKRMFIRVVGAFVPTILYCEAGVTCRSVNEELGVKRVRNALGLQLRIRHDDDPPHWWQCRVP